MLFYRGSHDEGRRFWTPHTKLVFWSVKNQFQFPGPVFPKLGCACLWEGTKASRGTQQLEAELGISGKGTNGGVCSHDCSCIPLHKLPLLLIPSTSATATLLPSVSSCHCRRVCGGSASIGGRGSGSRGSGGNCGGWGKFVASGGWCRGTQEQPWEWHWGINPKSLGNAALVYSYGPSNLLSFIYCYSNSLFISYSFHLQRVGLGKLTGDETFAYVIIPFPICVICISFGLAHRCYVFVSDLSW